MPSNATIVDFVLSQVQLKMKLANANPLAIRDIEKDVPILIKAAIIDLQRNDIIQPKTMRFATLDKKEEQRKIDGTLDYYFIAMPPKFREIKRLAVDGIDSYRLAEDEESLKSKPYTYYITVEENENETDYRLRLNPFPTDTQEIYIRFYEDGTSINFADVKETHWDAILTNVYNRLGFISDYAADSKMSDLVSQIKHPDGIGGKDRVKKRKAFYFGK
jgi:hypothetical protein